MLHTRELNVRAVCLQLVLINISDHFVRMRANGLAQGSGRVFGCLLGQQVGREVSISNSFEIIIEDGMEGPLVDEAFLTKKTEQCKASQQECHQCHQFCCTRALDSNAFF